MQTIMTRNISHNYGTVGLDQWRGIGQLREMATGRRHFNVEQQMKMSAAKMWTASVNDFLVLCYVTCRNSPCRHQNYFFITGHVPLRSISLPYKGLHPSITTDSSELTDITQHNTTQHKKRWTDYITDGMSLPCENKQTEARQTSVERTNHRMNREEDVLSAVSFQSPYSMVNLHAVSNICIF